MKIKKIYVKRGDESQAEFNRRVVDSLYEGIKATAPSRCSRCGQEKFGGLLLLTGDDAKMGKKTEKFPWGWSCEDCMTQEEFVGRSENYMFLGKLE